MILVVFYLFRLVNEMFICKTPKSHLSEEWFCAATKLVVVEIKDLCGKRLSMA